MSDVCLSCASIHWCFPLGLQVSVQEMMAPPSDWKLPETDRFSLPKIGGPNLETTLPCLVWASYSSKQRQDSGALRELSTVLSVLGLSPDQELVHEIIASISQLQGSRQAGVRAGQELLPDAHPKSADYLMNAFLCLLSYIASPQRTSSLKQLEPVDPALLSSVWAWVWCPQSSSTHPCSQRTRDEKSGRKSNQKSVVCPESCYLNSREKGLRRGHGHDRAPWVSGLSLQDGLCLWFCS